MELLRDIRSEYQWAILIGIDYLKSHEIESEETKGGWGEVIVFMGNGMVFWVVRSR